MNAKRLWLTRYIRDIACLATRLTELFPGWQTLVVFDLISFHAWQDRLSALWLRMKNATWLNDFFQCRKKSPRLYATQHYTVLV